MPTFKIIASKGGEVIFDRRIEADTPREAREEMKTALGISSLTGIVYAITEIPVELIREIVLAQMAGIAVNGNAQSQVDVASLVARAVDGAVSSTLAAIERRLTSLEGSHSTGPQNRRDPLANTPTPPDAESERKRTIPESIRAILGPDWKTIKRHYLKERSIKQTAGKFDVPVNTLKSRIRREGWGK